MKFNFNGHSGYKVEILPDSNIVRKSSTAISDGQRLKRQCEKQRRFNYYSEGLIAPSVFGDGYKDDAYYFDMELINATDFITYFQTSNKNKIDYVVNKIIMFIEYNIERSRFEIILDEVISEKLKSIGSYIYIRDIKKDDLVIDIPVGRCHGDLTFSNMLFDAENMEICLIDFLDDYIETPLNDIVKLRQDTKFGWSLLMYKNKVDKLKMNIIFNYIDNKIHKHFSRYDFYNKFYPLFEIINLMRVMRYATDDSIKRFLLTHINKCIDEINNTSSR